MDVLAKITGINYLPFLCRELNMYFIKQFENALSKDGAVILNIDRKRQIALSWWVSAKKNKVISLCEGIWFFRISWEKGNYNSNSEGRM